MRALFFAFVDAGEVTIKRRKEVGSKGMSLFTMSKSTHFLTFIILTMPTTAFTLSALHRYS